jgi:hypothetical protein
MDDTDARMAKAEADLRYALQILSSGGRYQPEEWMLIATLIGEADLALKEARQRVSRLHVPLLDTAIEALKHATSNLSNTEFLRSTRAARRRNPQLFSHSS